MIYGEIIKDKALGLYLGGLDAVAVGRKTGVSHAAVSRWVNEAGVKRVPLLCTYESPKEHPDHPSHGKLSGYDAGCRCVKCRNARKVYDKKVQIRKTLKELGYEYR